MESGKLLLNSGCSIPPQGPGQLQPQQWFILKWVSELHLNYLLCQCSCWSCLPAPESEISHMPKRSLELCFISLIGYICAQSLFLASSKHSEATWSEKQIPRRSAQSTAWYYPFTVHPPWLNREAEISSNNLPTCFSQSWWFRHQECSGIAAGLLQQGVLMLTGLRGTETLKERSTEVIMGCKLTHQCLGWDAAVS